MKIIYPMLLFLIILISSCGKEEIKDAESITAKIYDIDEPEIIEEKVVVEEERENIVTVRLCHDTDNGIVRWVNGSIFGFYSNATRFQFDDYCQNNNYLWEFYCEDEYPLQKIFFCRGGCSDGHCI